MVVLTKKTLLEVIHTVVVKIKNPLVVIHTAVVKIKNLMVVITMVVLTKKNQLVVICALKHKSIIFTLAIYLISAKINLEIKTSVESVKLAGGLCLSVFILIEYEFLGGVCQTIGWTSSTHFYLVILVESVKCRNMHCSCEVF